MPGAIANLVRVPELRRRLLFTALVLTVYRFGSWLPAPGVDPAAVSNFLRSNGSGIFGLLNLLSGSSLSRLSLFALGIVPYVTASIAVQLLTAVVPRLEQLQKEGEAGYARITQYTRYATVALAAAQATGYAYLFDHEGALHLAAGRLVIVVLTLTAGTTLLMWLGEQITKRGVGNGISIIIFASILTSAPTAIRGWLNGSAGERLFFPIAALLVVVSVVFVQDGQRKIPIQYARRMLGRQTVAVGSTYMPLRVNMAGVIPVIFAAALLALPPTLAGFLPSTAPFIDRHVQPGSSSYLAGEALLIVAFTFFYTAVQFNPVDQADNLRKYGGYIPGIRPGPPTAGYLDRVLSRLTASGALFLAAVAVAPCIFIRHAGFSQATSRALGGTSVLIVVGVALDTMRQMQAQTTTRRHEGFLKS
ncbi:MAG TPA: preprotein translocase subunit SecY [Gaiellaceae bacterium]|nr:preprotein translocase subunit SecY [Gaiellaceae bacterium]